MNKLFFPRGQTKEDRQTDSLTKRFIYIDVLSVVCCAGCFLIPAPDVCHDAKDGLSYCWCSSVDLCNCGEDGRGGYLGLVLIIVIFSIS